MTVKRKLILFSMILGTCSLGLVLLVLIGARQVVSDLVGRGVELEHQTSPSMGNRAPLVLVLVIVVMIIFMIVTILNRMVKPLIQLSEVANQIKNGNLEMPVSYHQKDEFGQVFQDFDEMRLQLKESVMARQRLEEMRSELIANIAHDLKTPITSINGYIKGLQVGVANTPEKQAKYLQIIAAKAAEMDGLVNELCLFSQLDTGQISFTKVKTNIGQYIREVFEEITFETSAIDISFHNSLTEDVFVWLDGFHFKRVLVNIAENSKKYRRFETVTLQVQLYEQEAEVIIKIADNGKGLAEAEAKRVFDRFYRSDTARMRPGSGSGLGLSIAKQIIEAHLGRIWAEGVVNEGLSIYLSMPKSRKEDQQ